MAAILSVLSTLLVGVLLAAVPWTALWDANYLLQPLAKDAAAMQQARAALGKAQQSFRATDKKKACRTI